MSLFLILGLLAAAVPAAFLIRHVAVGHRVFCLPVPALVSFVILALAAPQVFSGEVVAASFDWVPALDLQFAVNLHGWGLLLALLVTGIGSLILIYATGYMGGHPQAHRLYAYLYAFMFAMVGLAVADHLLLIFIFWELTSITSYLLIGFNHSDLQARKNALQALLVTGLGGMALLAGFILLADVAGTWRLSELADTRDLVTSSARYPAILTLVLLGAFTKSAQFPFHFWLPNAMAAPTPVSAYLHSATMVKAGVFLMGLMLPVLGNTTAWTITLTTAGGITLLLGGLFGMRQTDLKKILAGTTLAVLGMLTLLLGIGSEKAVLAAVLVLLGHALYKATLFMVAGSVDHETGTRETGVLGDLRRTMPFTAAAAGLAAVSKMGLPPMYGFIGKEYAYKSTLYSSSEILLTATLLVGSAILLALAIRTGILPFWKKEQGTLPKSPHEAPPSMLAGPLLLAGLGLVVGLLPGLASPLVSSATSAILGEQVEPVVKLWSGFNLPLLLSGLTLLVGLGIFFSRAPISKVLNAIRIPGAERAYEAIFAGVLALATKVTRTLQSGYLRNYLIIIIMATGTLILIKLTRFGGLGEIEVKNSATPGGVVMIGMMMFATWLAVTAKSRITALISLGTVGYGVALIFSIFSAPDLAITQILVETLTVVLFAWVVHKFPEYRDLSSKRSKAFDGVIATLSGIVVTMLVLKSKSVELGPKISETLTEMSYPLAHGANVVNVILVDFRALDTWGEICVLAIAALGVWALVGNLFSKSNRKSSS
ncbi:MAG: hydrogen gas-evolving membrane-bound hydrogenase subunit E [Luteolibacter sp.]